MGREKQEVIICNLHPKSSAFLSLPNSSFISLLNRCDSWNIKRNAMPFALLTISCSIVQWLPDHLNQCFFHLFQILRARWEDGTFGTRNLVYLFLSGNSPTHGSDVTLNRLCKVSTVQGGHQRLGVCGLWHLVDHFVLNWLWVGHEYSFTIDSAFVSLCQRHF